MLPKLTLYVGILISLVLQVNCSSKKIHPKNRWKTHDGRPLLINYYINDKANIQSEEAIRKTFQNWKAETGIEFQYRGRTSALLKKDGKSVVSFLLTWPEKLPQDKVAYCRLYYDSEGFIVESDIVFNMQMARFTTLAKNTPEAYYIEGVLSHEVGHMLGLKHSRDATSIMKIHSTADESYFKGKINSETLKKIKSIYNL